MQLSCPRRLEREDLGGHHVARAAGRGVVLAQVRPHPLREQQAARLQLRRRVQPAQPGPELGAQRVQLGFEQGDRGAGDVAVGAADARSGGVREVRALAPLGRDVVHHVARGAERRRVRRRDARGQGHGQSGSPERSGGHAPGRSQIPLPERQNEWRWSSPQAGRRILRIALRTGQRESQYRVGRGTRRPTVDGACPILGAPAVVGGAVSVGRSPAAWGARRRAGHRRGPAARARPARARRTPGPGCW